MSTARRLARLLGRPSASWVADAALVLFVGGYIVPGALLELAELLAWVTGHGPTPHPYTPHDWSAVWPGS